MQSAIRTYRDGVVLMTGAASGIGRALAEEVARQGAVVCLADRQADEVEQVAAGIVQAGGQAEARTLDVTDAVAVKDWIESSFRSHGRIDYLFNNAGIGVAGEAVHYQLQDWLRVLDVNLNGVIYGVHAAYPIMMRQRFGHIVNTASMAGLVPSPGVLSYTTSKHAVAGLSRALRLEAETFNVRVSVLCPGVIRTPIIDGGKYGSTVGPTEPSTMRKMFERLRPMDVNLFAQRALKDVAANRSVIIHPSTWRWAHAITRVFPRLAEMAGRQNLTFMRKEGMNRSDRPSN